MGLCASCCSSRGPSIDGAEDIAAITTAPVAPSKNSKDVVEPSVKPQIPTQPEASSNGVSGEGNVTSPVVVEKQEGDAEAANAAPVTSPPLTPATPALDIPNEDKKSSSSSSDVGKSPRRPVTPAEPMVAPKRQGEEGWYLVFSHTGQGSLLGRYCQKAPANSIMVSRPSQPFDENLYFQSPLELAKNCKLDFNKQSGATCAWLRTANKHGGEIEVKKDFYEMLPRKSMIVIHQEDGKIVTIRTPMAFDLSEKPVDAVAVVPMGSDVYKGFTSMKTHVFMDKGGRKGSSLRF